MKATITSAVLVVALSAAAAVANQQRVFRAEVNYVEVPVRVVDRNGQFVSGLTSADFEIREDYRTEKVDSAYLVELPTPWLPSGAAQPAVYKPQLPQEMQHGEGRIYLFYLNATADIPITRKLAKEFVNNYLLPGDIAAVWSAWHSVRFTDDKKLLNDVIDSFNGTSTIFTDPVPGTRDVGGRPGLLKAVDWLSAVQGRKKSVLLFTSGLGGLAPVFSEQAVVSPWTTELVDRSDVQMYVVDTRGLVARPPASGGASDAGQAAANVTAGLQFLSQELDSMRWLAEDAGGFAITNHNTYAASFRRIVDENSRYYVLGYQSSWKRSANWDYRQISVKVSKPGLKGTRIQARRGYVAR